MRKFKVQTQVEKERATMKKHHNTVNRNKVQLESSNSTWPVKTNIKAQQSNATHMQCASLKIKFKLKRKEQPREAPQHRIPKQSSTWKFKFNLDCNIPTFKAQQSNATQMQCSSLKFNFKLKKKDQPWEAPQYRNPKQSSTWKCKFNLDSKTNITEQQSNATQMQCSILQFKFKLKRKEQPWEAPQYRNPKQSPTWTYKLNLDSKGPHEGTTK